MADVLDCSSSLPQWNVHFSRVVNDWEMDAISDLFGLLYATNLGLAETDQMVCIRILQFVQCTRC